MCQMLNAVNGSKDQIHRSNVYGFGLSSCAPSLSASLPVSMGCLTRDFPQWRKDRPETLALPLGALCEGKCLRQLLLRSTCGPLLVEILPWGQIYGRRGCVPSAELGRTMRCMRRWPGSPASLWLGAKAFAFYLRWFTCTESSQVRTYMRYVYLPIHACQHLSTWGVYQLKAMLGQCDRCIPAQRGVTHPKRVNPLGRWFGRMAFSTGQPRFEPDGAPHTCASLTLL